MFSVSLNLLMMLMLLTGVNYVIADWFLSLGPLKIFSIMGATQIVSIGLIIPIYIYGKKLRSWTARRQIFKSIIFQ